MSVQANPSSSRPIRTEIRSKLWLDSRLALWIAAERLLVLADSPWAAGTPWNDQLGTTDTLWAILPNRIFMLPRRAQPLSAAV